jgi:hypothetical protein
MQHDNGDDHKKLTTLLSHYKGGTAYNGMTLLGLVEGLIDFCIWTQPKNVTALALWAIHMHTFDQFNITPRLAVLAPEENYGKTEVLDLLRHLAPLPRPELLLNPTPASLWQSVESGKTALLIDEGDNLSLKHHGQLRSILNANRKGAAIPRGGSPKKGGEAAEPKYFRPFIPVAVAAIGKLPRPLMTRCIQIKMKRKPRGVEKLQVDELDYQFMEAANLVLGAIMRWADNILLDRKPDLTGLDNRHANNWRPLLAIADAMGEGEKARNVARALIGVDNASMGTQLLIDIRTIFDKLKIDRIEREHLLRELHKLDAWNDWGRTSLLTKNEMFATLREYDVIGVHPVRISGELVQGWYRKDFEEAWSSC